MIDPRALDPNLFRNEDDDEEGEGCGHAPANSGGVMSYLEKSLIDSRMLLISGPVTDLMLKDATVRLLAM